MDQLQLVEEYPAWDPMGTEDRGLGGMWWEGALPLHQENPKSFLELVFSQVWALGAPQGSPPTTEAERHVCSDCHFSR